MEKNIIKGYIYKITNIKNGFCYIGKTVYKDINKRFQQHKYNAFVLQKGSKNSLYQAMREEGEDNFKIELLTIVYSPNSLEDTEKYFIKKYHSYIKDPLCHGYNLSKGGEGTHYNKQFAEDLSKKIINIYQELKNQTKVAKELNIDVSTVHNYLVMNGITRDDEKIIAIRETGKKVAIYKENQIIAIFPSLGEAARHFEEKEIASHLSEACYGKRKDVKGYIIQFTDKEPFNTDCILPTLKNKISNKKKAIIMIDPASNEILNTFESGCAAGRFFEMPRPQSATTCIQRAIQRDGTWRGYKWKYL